MKALSSPFGGPASKSVWFSAGAIQGLAGAVPTFHSPFRVPLFAVPVRDNIGDVVWPAPATLRDTVCGRWFTVAIRTFVHDSSNEVAPGFRRGPPRHFLRAAFALTRCMRA